MGSLRNGAVRAKILIWGAPGAGKTTTLNYVSSKLKSGQKGAVQNVTLKDPAGGYEVLPVELGEVKGIKTQLDFMTAPGAWEHASVRRQLLQGVDGVLFVANSSGSAMKDNQKALAELDDALKGMGRSLVTVPMVFEWMNQKAIGSMPTDEMAAKLNARIGAPSFPVPADDMGGILKAFATISKMVVKNVRDDYDQGKLAEPSPEVEPAAAADSGAVNPFADLASDLDEVPGDFAMRLEGAAGGFAAPEEAIDASALGDLLAETNPLVPDPVTGRNGTGKFKLVSAGEPTLASDGTLALPIRIGNEDGEEFAVTISVKVVPD